MYTNQLPSMTTLRRTVEVAKPFPATTKEISERAKKAGINNDVIEFLVQFNDDETFESRVDFITRCDELELLIQEERELPAENLRSSQD